MSPVEDFNCDDSGVAGWVDRLSGTRVTKSVTSALAKMGLGSGEADCSRWELFSRMVSRSGMEMGDVGDMGDVMLMQQAWIPARRLRSTGGHKGI